MFFSFSQFRILTFKLLSIVICYGNECGFETLIPLTLFKSSFIRWLEKWLTLGLKNVLLLFLRAKSQIHSTKIPEMNTLDEPVPCLGFIYQIQNQLNDFVAFCAVLISFIKSKFSFLL